jgi:SAM-dependent methyltransferase
VRLLSSLFDLSDSHTVRVPGQLGFGQLDTPSDHHQRKTSEPAKAARTSHTCRSVSHGNFLGKRFAPVFRSRVVGGVHRVATKLESDHAEARLEFGSPCGSLLFLQSQIELARRNVPNARFIAADICSLDFPLQSFNAAVGSYSFIHVPRSEHEALLRKIARWLKPRGLLRANSGSVTVRSIAMRIGLEFQCFGQASIWKERTRRWPQVALSY